MRSVPDVSATFDGALLIEHASCPVCLVRELYCRHAGDVQFSACWRAVRACRLAPLSKRRTVPVGNPIAIRQGCPKTALGLAARSLAPWIDQWSGKLAENRREPPAGKQVRCRACFL